MIEEKRIRYSFWTALADIGGFHDGLTLLVHVLMNPIAATFFENSILGCNLFAQHLSQDQKQKRRKLAQSLKGEQIDAAILTEPSNMETFLDAVKSLQPVSLSVCQSVIDCICRGLKRQRRQKAVRRLEKRYME